jgi:hypothetical protein
MYIGQYSVLGVDYLGDWPQPVVLPPTPDETPDPVVIQGGWSNRRYYIRYGRGGVRRYAR